MIFNKKYKNHYLRKPEDLIINKQTDIKTFLINTL